MAVAEAKHHSSMGQTNATAIVEVEERETRPASLAEPQGALMVLERHVAEQVRNS